MAEVIVIEEYGDHFRDEVIKLILDIQQREFGLSIDVADQPDLLVIPEFYQQGNGNFWVALSGEEVVGTIAITDFGEDGVALRKMFVKEEFRGREYGIGQQLLEILIKWCREKNVKAIYLGTLQVMKAAHRFYERNGFSVLPKEELPPAFPLMKVDNLFYGLVLNN